MTEWISKCPLDFGALLFEPNEGLQQVKHPTTLMVGAQTHSQTKRISGMLAHELPDARVVEVEGAGHLGPFTFRDKVTDLIAEHLRSVGTKRLVVNS